MTTMQCFICERIVIDVLPCPYNRTEKWTCEACCKRCHDTEPFPCREYEERRARKMQQKNRTARSWVSMRANTQGHFLEGYIKGACAFYKDQGRAYVEQIPEPFRVTSTNRNGSFTGRFIANAQPDFMGTMEGGRAICFEAKYTSKDRMQQAVVTDTQEETLEYWWAAGAKAGVCVNIGDVFAFIPWGIWRSMKAIYGRKYIKAEEAETFRVKFNGHVLFLDYVHPGTVANLEAQLWKQDEEVTEEEG